MAKVQFVMVKTVSSPLRAASNQGQALSVLGYLYALTMVGKLANPSEVILKTMAISPTFVNCQSIKPTIDKAPQNKSNLVSFQTDCLLKKVAIKISSAKKPTLNVRID